MNTIVDAKQTFNIDVLPIKALSRAIGWAYSGISFTLEERFYCSIKYQVCFAAGQIDYCFTQATTTAIHLEGFSPSKNVPLYYYDHGASYHQLI